MLGTTRIITRTAEAKQKTEEKGIDEQVRLAVLASIANDKYAVDGTMLEEALTNSFGEDGYTISGNSSSGWKIKVGDLSYKINSKGEIKEAVTSVKMKDKNNDDVTITKSNVGTYYGEVVDYTKNTIDTDSDETADTSMTYRLFYIDFDGLFGDAGTIYLKADYGYSTVDNSGYNNNYCTPNKYWWLASASDDDEDYLCIVYGTSYLSCEYYEEAYGFCPLVSLKSTVTHKFVNK